MHVTAPQTALNASFIVHVGLFLGAAMISLAGIPRLDGISDADTRRGLRWLLLTSAGWAAAHVAFLVLPGRTLKLASYSVGLVVGFAAIGAWLYVCSAYTGRAYHRNPTYRRAALVVFGAVIAVKLTNPLHHAYYTVTTAQTPFPHLAIATGPLHWIAMGLAYALAFVGYFMLFELFVEIDSDTRPLLLLVALTGSPVLLDLVGATTNLLVDITYEPLGVAAFAIGVSWVYRDRFDEIQLAAQSDVPVIALDRTSRIRDFNHRARSLLPALENSRGTDLATALPEVASRLGSEDPILPLQRDGATRYYRITEATYGTVKAGLGRTIVLTDITNRERYRRELERQNARLDRFAGMVSHDLRNPLNVAQGRAALIAEELGSDDPNVEAVEHALERMEELIEDILTLARTGQSVEDWTRVSLDTMARESWAMVDVQHATLVVEDDTQLRAAPDRLKRLFENLFRNSLDHVGSDVTVFVGTLPDGTGFYVADDGPGIPEDSRDEIFEPGFTTREEGTGFGLAIVSEVADAHGWNIAVTDQPDGGARFEVTGVELVD